ncbi:MAG TPA: metallophosphoesterase [Myxococcales bacterium]
MRIVHLSDVHVQIDYGRLPLRRYGWRRAVAQLEWVGLRRAKRFENALGTLHQIVREILELAPDHVVLSGDLTALAVEEEFACARAALAPLWRPEMLSLIPGNHDRYTAHAARERRFERHFGDLLRSDLPAYAGPHGFPFVRLVSGELAVVGLDSTRLAPLPGLSFGSLGGEQLRALSRLIEDPAVRDRRLAVLVHHAPLRENGRPDRVTHGLLDGPQLLRMLAGRRASVHHGHVHHRYWHPATAGRPDVFNAGSATEGGHEGYWVVEFGPQGRVSAQKRVPRPSPPVGCCPS